MGTGLLKNQAEAIKQFINDKLNGQAWRKILFEAPAIAMERIAISMWHSIYGKTLSAEEKEMYRALREEIEATLEREDLEYLIKVMPLKQKEHYKALLSLLPSRKGNAPGAESTPSVQQPQPQTPAQ